MEHRRLRVRCEARLRQLHLPVPFELAAFCVELGRRRGRLIHLCPTDGDHPPFGLWLAGETADYVFYERRTSTLHRDHIILHEISHLLCDHAAGGLLDQPYAALLLPNLDTETIRRVLGRTGYSLEEEREAELLASLILRQAKDDAPAPPGAGDADDNALLTRLEAALE